MPELVDAHEGGGVAFTLAEWETVRKAAQILSHASDLASSCSVPRGMNGPLPFDMTERIHRVAGEMRAFAHAWLMDIRQPLGDTPP